jgi:hypothetical protein
VHALAIHIIVTNSKGPLGKESTTRVVESARTGFGRGVCEESVRSL